MSRLARERNAADFYTLSETFAADVSVDEEQMNSNGRGGGVVEGEEGGGRCF